MTAPVGHAHLPEVPLVSLVDPGGVPGPGGDGPAVNQFALDHQREGLSGLTTDVVSLAGAAIASAAISASVLASAHAPSYAFAFSLVRLLGTVPVLAVFLATTRGAWSLRSRFSHHVASVAPAIAMGGLAAMAAWSVAHAVGVVQPPGSTSVLLLCGLGVVAVTLARAVHHAPPRRHGRRARRVLVVGTGLVATRIADELGCSEGVEFVGCVDNEPVGPQPCRGRLSELGTICENDDIDHVIVAFTRASPEEILGALRPIHGRIPITVIPRLFDMLPVSAGLHYLGAGLSGISVAPATLGRGPRAVKRAIDLVGAGLALLVLSPLLVVIAMAIKLTSKGPVFYRHTRIGRNGENFTMEKFRSMHVGASAGHPSSPATNAVLGPFPKLKDDPRITPVGRIIRRTSLDELPQLFNVLRGDMSLVGPRPFVPDDAAWIGGWAQRRYSVRPGITGLWQVSGRNDLTFDEMCRLDSQYVSCWSIGLDLQILLRTLRAVVGRSGAY